MLQFEMDLVLILLMRVGLLRIDRL